MVFIGKSEMRFTSPAIVLVTTLILGFPTLGLAKSYDIGAEEQADFVEAKPVYTPQPVIPPEKHENCFKSCCLARFFIAKDGKTKVKLLSSSGSNEIDDITLITLRRWKFKPAMLDGQPVESTRRIKVEFEVN